MARDEQPKGKSGGGSAGGAGGGRWHLLAIGLLLGFLTGWWFPAPQVLRFDEFRTSTNARLCEQGRRARNKVADLTEALARRLRTSGKVEADIRQPAGNDAPLQVLEPAPADVPPAASHAVR